MNIDFGVVKKYFSDRGFGFVTHTFSACHKSEVFFHINNIKRQRYDLAKKLENEESINAVYFWYETENSNKGEQVSNVLKSGVVHNIVIENLESYVSKIESIWSNIDSTIPGWLRDVTIDLVGVDRASELSLEREVLEREKRDFEERRRKEWEAHRKIEEAMRQKLIENQKIQKEIEEKEFKQLVEEMKHRGFTHSNQVSLYIKDNKLGCKYKNISGPGEFEQNGTSWILEYTIKPNFYARLCEKLGLSNQGTQAKLVRFTPFKDL